MSEVEFFAIPAQKESVETLSEGFPTNPFVTANYLDSMNPETSSIWILGLKGETEKFVAGCLARIRSGKLLTTLDIPSLPCIDSNSEFWGGLEGFCKEHKVTNLELGSFCTPGEIEIPVLGTQFTKRSRCEFVLDLVDYSLSSLSSNHKRNVKKAEKAGIEMISSRSSEAARRHHELMELSFERRRNRGENMGLNGASPRHMSFLNSGAGEIFQAVLDGEVLSSILVLQAPKGAYYQSAGTSPEGMKLGASQFLIHSLLSQLKTEGVEVFSLGSADEGTGLERFKKGFGPRRVELSAVKCSIGPSWRRWLSSVVEKVRRS